MSTAVTKVARLKAEIYLGQAISEFQACLSPSQKVIFHAQQAASTPPGIRDIMQLTAEINLSTGPGGGSAVCCSRWYHSQWDTEAASMRVVKYVAYFERLSMILMAVGQSAPRYQIMGALYPKPERLRSCMLEIFIAGTSATMRCGLVKARHLEGGFLKRCLYAIV
ncbi:hypothetical protein BDV12DRAFT_204167 [Aspergillus spectabilis]